MSEVLDRAIAKGEARGIAKGRAEGRAEKSKEIALSMYMEGYPFGTIAKLIKEDENTVKNWITSSLN